MSRTTLRLAADAFGLALVTCAAAQAQTTTRVSVNSSGIQAHFPSESPRITGDGRWVTFTSRATNFDAMDSNNTWDVFVRDRVSGTTERASISTMGTEGYGPSIGAMITEDGRYVLFACEGWGLVVGDMNDHTDVFVRDRSLGTTERWSVDAAGAEANGDSYPVGISSDGRYVAFWSDATNLVPGDTNGAADLFVRDLVASTVEIASLDEAGNQVGDGQLFGASMSSDARFVAFGSLSSVLVAGDSNSLCDVFVRDRLLGTTERVSVDSGGAEGDGDSGMGVVQISADGRFVTFASWASNLVADDTNNTFDVFVHDRATGTTERVSVNSSGTEGDGGSQSPSISADGRFVAFWSIAHNLVAADTNLRPDIFLRDRLTGTTERMSVAGSGAQANNDSYESFVSATGRYVAFSSYASNLIPFDPNGIEDIFVNDREGGPSFTSLCHPGIAGVIGCPCSNPPSGPGRGCDNSAATGGATLAATGATYLSSDSLVLTTSGEKPTALSVVFQGTTSPSAGLVYGQGVRCAGGSLKRLYSKNASGGSITAPDFGAGETRVSARSAAKGDVIPAGGTRYYFVAYRDPVVLGGCPAASTLNVTTTGRVTWSP